MSDYLLDIFGGIVYTPIGWGDGVALLIILLLLIGSAFMSSNEVAFFSLSPQDVQSIKEQSHTSDASLLKLLSHSEQLLATILIGNNIVNVAITILSAWFITQHWDFSAAPVAGFVIQTVFITFLLLLFGEIMPKVYAQSRPLAFIRATAPFVAAIYRATSWAARGLMKTGKVIDWVESNRRGKGVHELSVDDLSKAVALTTTQSDVEMEMISEIVKFYNKTADEIMVPRIDMVSVDYQWGYRQVLSFVVESGFSRIPVYEGSQDTIKGILYIKDLLPHRDEPEDFHWQKLIRPAYFVPENKKIDDLLEELRQEHIHMAIVVDEFGGTCGLATMEDILEQIVGEITDEYDDDERPYVRIADNTYMLEGRMMLSDLIRLLNLDDQYFAPYQEEVDTVGGLVLEILQEIPQVGRELSVRELTLTVTRMERHRITQVKLLYTPLPTEVP